MPVPTKSHTTWKHWHYFFVNSRNFRKQVNPDKNNQINHMVDRQNNGKETQIVNKEALANRAFLSVNIVHIGQHWYDFTMMARARVCVFIPQLVATQVEDTFGMHLISPYLVIKIPYTVILSSFVFHQTFWFLVYCDGNYALNDILQCKPSSARIQLDNILRKQWCLRVQAIKKWYVRGLGNKHISN